MLFFLFHRGSAVVPNMLRWVLESTKPKQSQNTAHRATTNYIGNGLKFAEVSLVLAL